jgi:cytochrome c553
MRQNFQERSDEMKQMLWIPAIAAALVFGGCSQQTKEDVKKAAESVSQDASKAADTAKEKASEAMEKAKKQAAEALESAKAKSAEMEKAAKAKAAEAAAVVEKKAAAIKKDLEANTVATPEEPDEEATIRKPGDTSKKPAAQTVAPSKNGAALYAKCAGCHGSDGKTKALGKSPAIAGQDAARLRKAMEEYKAGTRNAYGMGGVMAGQAKGLSDSDIAALADYISKL